MREGRRRSGRLIDSPWLYKWPKMYIDSDESERNINIEGGAEQNAIENRNGVGGRRPVADYFDLKNEVRVGTSCVMWVLVVLSAERSEEGEEFVTPGEFFQESNKSCKQVGTMRSTKMQFSFVGSSAGLERTEKEKMTSTLQGSLSMS